LAHAFVVTTAPQETINGRWGLVCEQTKTARQAHVLGGQFYPMHMYDFRPQSSEALWVEGSTI
jgi:hypothetical protein